MIKKYLMIGIIIISVIGLGPSTISYAETNTNEKVSSTVGITFRDDEKINTNTNNSLPNTGDNTQTGLTLIGLLFLLCFVVTLNQKKN